MLRELRGYLLQVSPGEERIVTQGKLVHLKTVSPTNMNKLFKRALRYSDVIGRLVTTCFLGVGSDNED